MRTNVVKPTPAVFNNEGIRAVNKSPEDQLSRLLFTCMLWEDNFYSDGKTVADQMAALVPQCRPDYVAAAAYHARSNLNLRHAPLQIVREMLRHPEHKKLVGKLLPDVIQRPDEINEFMSLYWKDGKTAIAKQAKIGLGKTFAKFNAYQLAKWDKDAEIKLRDVMFLVHAKPADATGITKEQRKVAYQGGAPLDLQYSEKLYKELIDGELTPADTWEERLSAGADKKATFEAMMLSKELGALAFLRNLRNMKEADVDREIIRLYSQEVKLDRVLPYRFIAAARAVPGYEDILEPMMFRVMAGQPKLPGKTAVILDISPSMKAPLAQSAEKEKRDAWARSKGKAVLPPLTRKDAALGLGIMARELFDEVDFFSVSSDLAAVPPRRGFALGDALYQSQQPNGTKLGLAMTKINAMGYDRVIMLTDEESQDRVPNPTAPKAYMINVASSQHGVGFGHWVTVSGFSEAVLDYIVRLETDAQVAP
jgi:60 kDa SS-A/Ro ribonucleoprotein